MPNWRKRSRSSGRTTRTPCSVRRGAGVVAAVLDTGIDTDHPMLAPSFDVPGVLPHRALRVPGRAERGGGQTPDTGTHVSGIITSNGPPVGVAPDAAIEAFKVLDNTGSGTFADVLLAYDEIIVSHPEVDLINMSLGDGGSYAAGSCEALIPAFTAAMATTRAMGITSFVAAGNNGLKAGLGHLRADRRRVRGGAVYDAAGIPFFCDVGERAGPGCVLFAVLRVARRVSAGICYYIDVRRRRTDNAVRHVDGVADGTGRGRARP